MSIVINPHGTISKDITFSDAVYAGNDGRENVFANHPLVV